MLSVKNMKVGFRLGAAFSLVILLLIIVSVTAVIKISNINNLNEGLKHDFLLSIQEVNNRSILFGEEPTILLLLCAQHK